VPRKWSNTFLSNCAVCIVVTTMLQSQPTYKIVRKAAATCFAWTAPLKPDRTVQTAHIKCHVSTCYIQCEQRSPGSGIVPAVPQRVQSRRARWRGVCGDGNMVSTSVSPSLTLQSRCDRTGVHTPSVVTQHTAPSPSQPQLPQQATPATFMGPPNPGPPPCEVARLRHHGRLAVPIGIPDLTTPRCRRASAAACQRVSRSTRQP